MNIQSHWDQPWHLDLQPVISPHTRRSVAKYSHRRPWSCSKQRDVTGFKNCCLPTKGDTFCPESAECVVITQNVLNVTYFFNTSSLCLGRPLHRHIEALPPPPEQRDWSRRWWTSGEDPGPFCWPPAPVQPIVWKSWGENKASLYV